MVNVIMSLYIYRNFYVKCETRDKILDEQRMGMGILEEEEQYRAYMISRIVEADEYNMG